MSSMVGHSPSSHPHLWRTTWLAAMLSIGIFCDAFAGISTDSSLGRPAQTLTGTNYLIPETLGKLSGSNLFHSFQTFNISTGESANFTTATSGIANVISRVTGGSLSQINGLLSLTPCTGCGAPNFFFINPAGVAFGAGASIDVPGAFHVSTADYVKFPDGNFSANLNQTSTFSSAPPEAFGFLGTTRASIAINGGVKLATRILQPISIVAGDIEINNGTISAQGGDIRMAALGQGVQKIGFTGVLPAADGNLSILNGDISSDTSSSVDAGSVKVSAGSIVIDRQESGYATGIFSDALTGSTGDAGSVEVAATGNISIANGGYISSSAYSSGNASLVKVSADSIVIYQQGSGDATGVFSNAYSGSTGDAGSIEILATGNIFIADGGYISSSTYSSGNAGLVKVGAGSIDINAQGAPWTGIFSNAYSGSTGDAGSIEILSTGNLSIINGGFISSDTDSSGDAGSVKISAGSIVIDRRGSSDVTGVFSDASSGSTGNAGSVEVTAAGSFSIINGGFISSDTYSSGNAGSVKVGAGSIDINAQGAPWTGVFSNAYSGSTGNAGSIEVTAAGNLSIANGGFISSDTSSSGNAGSIKIGAGSIVIDRQGSSDVTGIFSDARIGSTGNAGNVEVAATGNLSIIRGGYISSDTYSLGNAGMIKVGAGSIDIDAQGAPWTGIYSNAYSSSTGNAGNVEVIAARNISIINGSYISSNTYSSGDAGSVKINAGSIVINRQESKDATGIFSDAKTGSTGNAGTVEVTAARSLSIVDGSQISSSTWSSGNAGTIKINTDSIVIDRQGGSWTGIASAANPGSSGHAGSIEILATGNLSIASGGYISSDTYTSGNAGSIKVVADSIVIDRQGSGDVTGIGSGTVSGTGSAGNVDVTAVGNLSIINGGTISSSTWSSGNAGYVSINAGSIAIDSQGSSLFTGITSSANTGSAGDAGYVDVTATENLSIVNSGAISSSTWSSGNAGYVLINAGSIVIDRQGSGDVTGIFSDAKTSSTGNAGSVEVTAAGNLSIINGGYISSDTYSSGNAGSIKVGAGSIVIDRKGSGDATGIFSDAISGSTGNAGAIEVTAAGNFSIINGGFISSDTYSSGNAGSVKVGAGSINIDAQGTPWTGIFSNAYTDSTGDAGSIEVTAAGNLSIVNGGFISSDTYSSGGAGSIKVSAGTLVIGGNSYISSDAAGSGNAGIVEVSATGHLSITNGGEISSKTYDSGNAGTVNVNASTLLVDGESSSINASAIAGSSGQTGSVIVNATDSITLSNGSEIAIRNDATVVDPFALMPTSISVSAPHITVHSSPNAITTTSTGNVAAGSIKIIASDKLYLDSSGITTTSNQGNGGAIEITAGIIRLDKSQIATSVLGLAGNGGDIHISARGLVMETGFIQANTAAKDASGGNVGINVQMLVPSGNTLFLGGDTPYTYQPGIFGFNVIQAAAPTGVSGTIQMTAPVLDVSGSLTGLNTQMIDTGGLGRSPCQATGGSSLAQTGRGGLPPSGRGLLRVEPVLLPIKSGEHADVSSDYMHVALSELGCT